jgi:S-formylglutathione hydrolase FrmB
MVAMSAGAPRETWLDGLGEWAWPGSPAAALELAPASWVPALPLRIAAPVLPLPARARRRPLPRPLRLVRLVVLLAVGTGTFLLSGNVVRRGAEAAPAPGATPVTLGGRLEEAFAPPLAAAGARAGTANAAPPARTRALAHSGPAFDVLAPAPVPVTVARDRAGSTIAKISFHSRSLGWTDTYLVYLPPGYRIDTHRRYPTLYLLHGDTQQASSFLRLGVARTLDRLISRHAIAPLIAVMPQANGLPDNWRDGSGPQYKTYVSEVQRMTDRVLRTIPARASRAIAGYSMGGFGAMNVALAHLRNYSVVESWEGFFNNLSRELSADRPLLARLSLHAFVWGGRQDTIASSAGDAPWAAALRAAGAQARSAVYRGGHDFATLERHLTAMLTFAGRELRS